MVMKPIATRYNGILFRSRLEARWAIFLDECGASWEYIEGFPDFRIRNVRICHGIDMVIPDLSIAVVRTLVNKLDAKKIEAFYDLKHSDRTPDSKIYPYSHPVLCRGMFSIVGDPEDPDAVIPYFAFHLTYGYCYKAIPGLDEEGMFTIFDRNHLKYMNKPRTIRTHNSAGLALF